MAHPALSFIDKGGVPRTGPVFEPLLKALRIPFSQRADEIRIRADLANPEACSATYIANGETHPLQLPTTSTRLCARAD